jgi:hypothetical protein
VALTKYNFNSFDVTSAASKALGFNSSANGFATINPGSMTLIKTLTASSDSTLSFVDGSSDVVLDSTYPVYLFKFINIHPATDGSHFNFNMSVDSGSNYNVTKTTTLFQAFHKEDGSSTSLSYDSSRDLAQGTGFQNLNSDTGNDNDQSVSGHFYLFNPSSTTFVKHFISTSQTAHNLDFSINQYVAGYGNTTSAVDAVQFKMSSGNIDSGTIKLYGIKDS